MTSNSTYPAWAIDQCIREANVTMFEGGKKYHRFMKSIERLPNTKGNESYYSMIVRQISGFSGVKYGSSLNPDGYELSKIKITTSVGSMNYCYLYWRVGTSELKPEYICVSPTYESKDGEYREAFTKYVGHEIASTLQMKMHAPRRSNTSKNIQAPVGITRNELISPIEQRVMEFIETGKISLEIHSYPVNDARNSWIDLNRLAITTLSQMMYEYRFKNIVNKMPVHVHSSYTAIFDLLDISDLVLTVPPAGYRSFGNTPSGKCGQKIVPMKLREAMQPFDYNLPVWRELFISEQIGDLVINNISPSFPFYNQWTYLEHCDATVFDNKSMLEKYIRSVEVDEAVDLVRQARHKLVVINDQTRQIEELNASLYDAIVYSQSTLKMSECAIIHTMERVGTTLQSLPDSIRYNHGSYRHNLFDTAVHAARHVFELAYGVHCLHSKLGFIHGDLHMNNMTLNIFRRIEERNLEPAQPNWYVAYVTGTRGEIDTFVFPTSINVCCIIDMSRSIVGPLQQPIIEAEHGKAYTSLLYKEQVNRVIRTIYRFIPTFVTSHQEQIKALVLAHFENIFPALCAIDYISIGNAMQSLYESDDKSLLPNAAYQFIVDPVTLKMGKKLEVLGREYLMNSLLTLIDDPNAVIKFPGETLLHIVFADHLFSNVSSTLNDESQLLDVFIYDKTMKYSGSSYDKFPIWSKLEEIEKRRGSIPIELLTSNSSAIPVDSFLDSLRPYTKPIILSEQIKQEQEKLDGQPQYTQSSWIVD
jgi:hypothetical protein